MMTIYQAGLRLAINTLSEIERSVEEEADKSIFPSRVIDIEACYVFLVNNRKKTINKIVCDSIESCLNGIILYSYMLNTEDDKNIARAKKLLKDLLKVKSNYIPW